MRPTPSALPALVLVACSSATAPEEARVLGEIAGYNAGDPHIEVPATAVRGVPFAVVVRTYGGGCHRVGDREVRPAGPAAADVTPYDFTRPGAVCTLQLKAFTHTAAVRFEGAGPARVRVRGRQRPDGARLVVERDVLVR